MNYFSKYFWPKHISFLSVAVSTRDTGRMAKDTDWEWRVVENGCIVESGPRASKVAMESDSQHRPQPSTRGHGPMVSKTAMAQKHTLMEVRKISSPFKFNKLQLKYCFCQECIFQPVSLKEKEKMNENFPSCFLTFQYLKNFLSHYLKNSSLLLSC